MKPENFLIFKQLFLRRVQVSYKRFLIIKKRVYGHTEVMNIRITFSSKFILVIIFTRNK